MRISDHHLRPMHIVLGAKKLQTTIQATAIDHFAIP